MGGQLPTSGESPLTTVGEPQTGVEAAGSLRKAPGAQQIGGYALPLFHLRRCHRISWLRWLSRGGLGLSQFAPLTYYAVAARNALTIGDHLSYEKPCQEG
jgi:hypothetical protein